MGIKYARKLTDISRAFIVRELACFASPKEAVEAIRDKFDIDITPQSAEHYDATKVAGKSLSDKWTELFALTREAFLDDAAKSVPFANKSVRIRELAKTAQIFKISKNYLAMSRILEQIAKEVGNVHTNRHEFTGAHGGPIRYADVSDMTSEQIEAELREYGIDPAQVHNAPKRTQ